MNILEQKKVFTFGMIVLVSLTLLGCSSGGTERNIDQKSPEEIAVVPKQENPSVDDEQANTGAGTATPQAEQGDRPPRPEGGEGGRPPRPEGGEGGRPPRPEGGEGGRPPRPGAPEEQTEEELEANKALIAAREEETTTAKTEDSNNGKQTITASEVIYPAKVGDTVEAHPAWLTVSVTLENDIITQLDIEQESSSPKSARHQSQFAGQIEGQVVGKKLSESDDIYLSVASSTSTAFNESIKEIQELYAQSQS